MSIKVIIASESPVKISAVKAGFRKMFPESEIYFDSFSVPSGVSDQPLSDLETYTGARNRSEYAYASSPDADYWVGIEGGLDEFLFELEAFAWVFIKSKEKEGKARTATFFLPERISKLIRQGKELGEADDIVFGMSDSKKKNGAVGILTRDVSNRTDYYSEAVILALIPFINETLY
jgi:inosine/xanthosine triphosphatase